MPELRWTFTRRWIRKRFFRAAVLDTEKLTKDKHQVQPGALAEVVKAKEAYVQEYINFFLGNVKKCESLDELRECRIGVTPDCMLYQSYKLQHMNPENYTRRAYIGETSMRQRIRKLEEKMREVKWRENAGTGAVRRDPPGNADGDVETAGRGLSRMAG